MNHHFSRRMNNAHKSFIREILKVGENPSVISFAGGLPNPDLFPIKEIQEACNKVLTTGGADALQYSTTEGYLPLREYIAGRYLKRFGLTVDPAEILITNGSQQGLDLLGKIFIDEGDNLIIEQPGYLGAIQAFTAYTPNFFPVPLNEDGIDIATFSETVATAKAKFFYCVPNFQNPSGITYTKECREQVARILDKSDTLLIEDDPYGELRFIGEPSPTFRSYLGTKAIILGTFSKIVVPSFRLGWVYAPKRIMEKLIIAKQGTDLHTNYFSQKIVSQYLQDYNIDDHIEKIKVVYKKHRDTMIRMIEQHFPSEIEYTKPEGGMFLWVTLPAGLTSMALFERALTKDVAFVPGNPFFVNTKGNNTLRLNYSNANEEMIEKGIKS